MVEGLGRAIAKSRFGTMPLKLISAKSYSAAENDIPVVCPVKNERGLLPHFIGHHRALGIENFIFIDNNSTDGTVDYLLSQPGCTVYHTSDSYEASHYAADWVSEVMRENFLGRWAIYLDCDELLVYEDMERTPLPMFIERYAAGGADSFVAVMVDMYPDGPWKNVSAKSVSSISNVLNCFDRDYVIRRPALRPGRPQRPGAINVFGGPRCRLFSSLEQDANRGWLYYAFAGQIDRFIDYVPISAMPTLARVWPRGTMAFFKTPLNKIGADFAYPYSHESTNTRKAGSMLGILHLKFCDELNARFDPQFCYDHHYRHGLDSFRLAGALERWGNKSLRYAGTERYVSSLSLSNAGIIGEPSAIFANGKAYYRTGLRTADA